MPRKDAFTMAEKEVRSQLRRFPASGEEVDPG
jgi:hypothetical protein